MIVWTWDLNSDFYSEREVSIVDFKNLNVSLLDYCDSDCFKSSLIEWIKWWVHALFVLGLSNYFSISFCFISYLLYVVSTCLNNVDKVDFYGEGVLTYSALYTVSSGQNKVVQWEELLIGLRMFSIVSYGSSSFRICRLNYISWGSFTNFQRASFVRSARLSLLERAHSLRLIFSKVQKSFNS